MIIDWKLFSWAIVPCCFASIYSAPLYTFPLLPRPCLNEPLLHSEWLQPVFGHALDSPVPVEEAKDKPNENIMNNEIDLWCSNESCINSTQKAHPWKLKGLVNFYGLETESVSKTILLLKHPLLLWNLEKGFFSSLFFLSFSGSNCEADHIRPQGWLKSLVWSVRKREKKYRYVYSVADFGMVAHVPSCFFPPAPFTSLPQRLLHAITTRS